MSTTEATQPKSANAKAVDEEYEKLKRFQVDHRKIVFLNHDDPPQGGFGIVLRAELHESAYLPAGLASRWYGPPQLVAVKQIKVQPGNITPRVKRAFTREMLVWSSLEEHTGIAKFLGFFADFKRGQAWLLSPWEPNGNVSEFIKKHNPEVPEKMSLIYDTIDALTFLHERDPPVCHGDIKAANVLVGADYKARFCDFGLARLHEDSGFGRLETSTGMKGSIRWCSPEILNNAPRAPTSDVYAWAWLVWEIMTGDLPYEGTSADYAIMREIFESPLPQVDGVSRLSDCLQIWDLMKRCWSVDPHQRPTARICKSTIYNLPRCTPTAANADHHNRSAALLESLGDLESWKGNLTESNRYLGEALQLFQAEADIKGIASVLRKQAATAYYSGDFDNAIATATTALGHYRTLKDAIGIADASLWLGDSFYMRYRNDEALSNLSESLQIYRTHGNDVGTARCLERIGAVYDTINREEEAQSTLDEAVAVASRSGDRMALAKALNTLGFTSYNVSNFVKSLEVTLEADRIARDIGWERGVGMTSRQLGRLKMRSGDLHQAKELLQESISIARRREERYYVAWGLQELGVCFRRQSKLDEAALALEESCLVLQELSQKDILKNVASTLVEVKSDQGDWDGALVWHDHIIAVCRSEKSHSEVADHLKRKGRILMKTQRYDEAALHFEAAVVTRRDSEDSDDRESEDSDDWESEDSDYWERWQLHKQLSAIPKTVMKWERRLPLLCNLKKLQLRQPQLVTASLKLPIPIGHTES